MVRGPNGPGRVAAANAIMSAASLAPSVRKSGSSAAIGVWPWSTIWKKENSGSERRLSSGGGTYRVCSNAGVSGATSRRRASKASRVVLRTAANGATSGK